VLISEISTEADQQQSYSDHIARTLDELEHSLLVNDMPMVAACLMDIDDYSMSSYPDLSSTLDRHKDRILSRLTLEIRHKAKPEDITSAIRSLKNLGAGWAELDRIDTALRNVMSKRHK